jgi:hypothetical protein
VTRRFVQSMTVCLRQIWGYKQLRLEVERLRCRVPSDTQRRSECFYRCLIPWKLSQQTFVSKARSKGGPVVTMFLRRAESFDDCKLPHETGLLELWTLLQPDRPLLKRVTRQWQDIGNSSSCYGVRRSCNSVHSLILPQVPWPAGPLSLIGYASAPLIDQCSTLQWPVWLHY